MSTINRRITALITLLIIVQLLTSTAFAHQSSLGRAFFHRDHPREEIEDPVEYTIDIINKTPTFWNPLGYATARGVYTIGAYAAMHGVGYLLLESPDLAVSLATGGLYGLGTKVGYDLLVEISESTIQTPRTACKKVSQTVIKQGLDEYDAAYRIAREYAKNGTLSHDEALEFLYNRWGILKLGVAQRLYNQSREVEYSGGEWAAGQAHDAALGLLSDSYKDQLGVDQRLPLLEAARYIDELSDILERSEVGLYAYPPYLEFEENMRVLNEARLREAEKFLIEAPSATITAVGTTVTRSEVENDTGQELRWRIEYAIDGTWKSVFASDARTGSMIDLLDLTSSPGEHSVVLELYDPVDLDFEVISNEVTVASPQPPSGESGNPAPTISGIQPARFTIGSPSFTLIVDGTGFVPGVSQLTIGGWTGPATVTSNTSLEVPIDGAELVRAGQLVVFVENGEPGGGRSNPVMFTIEAAPALLEASSEPVIQIQPASGPVGTSITVQGYHWPAASSVIVDLGKSGSSLALRGGDGAVVVDGYFETTIELPAGEGWESETEAIVVAYTSDFLTSEVAGFTIEAPIREPTIEPTEQPEEVPVALAGTESAREKELLAELVVEGTEVNPSFFDDSHTIFIMAAYWEVYRDGDLVYEGFVVDQDTLLYSSIDVGSLGLPEPGDYEVALAIDGDRGERVEMANRVTVALSENGGTESAREKELLAELVVEGTEVDPSFFDDDHIIIIVWAYWEVYRDSELVYEGPAVDQDTLEYSSFNVGSLGLPDHGQYEVALAVGEDRGERVEIADRATVALAEHSGEGTTSSCTPNAAFVTDVTVPDGTKFDANEKFTKTWRMRNTGTCPWDQYRWEFVSGDSLGRPSGVTVTDTSAGASTDISVRLQAPGSPGTYKGFWQMADASGNRFGEKTYIMIVVPASVSAPAASILGRWKSLSGDEEIEFFSDGSLMWRPEGEEYSGEWGFPSEGRLNMRYFTGGYPAGRYGDFSMSGDTFEITNVKGDRLAEWPDETFRRIR